LPLAHGKQPPCPASGCAYPAAHSLHIDAPAAENVPAGQSPLAAERAVPEQYLPEGQAVHDVWPARAWNWPAGHAAHEDDGAEKKEPAGHGAGADVDAGAVVKGDESGADVAVVAAEVVAAAVVAAAVVAAAVVAAAVVAAAVVAAAVVAVTAVAAAAADVASGIAAVVSGAAAAVLMAVVEVAANDVVPGPTVVPNAM
jgi:hypothetical protein